MMTFLILLVTVLTVITIAQVVRIFELATELRGPEDVDTLNLRENRMNARFMLIFVVGFLGFCVWQVMKYKDLLLPESASEHGLVTDKLFDVTMLLISVVFVITNILLFYYAFRYYYKPERKAYFFSHSTKLEMIWTIIPAIVLTFLITYGLSVWNKVTSPAPDNALVIELYAKQFDWTARYAGADNKLGGFSYKKIDATNALGIDINDKDAKDDILVKGEFHIPVGKPILFKFRSQDVIHSAFMPHFRLQMNTVPGMSTQFHFVPRLTTQQMRDKTGNPKFDYVLLCNKICGAAHYNMQMSVVVDTQEDYDKWLATQKPTFASAQ